MKTLKMYNPVVGKCLLVSRTIDSMYFRVINGRLSSFWFNTLVLNRHDDDNLYFNPYLADSRIISVDIIHHDYKELDMILPSNLFGWCEL